MIYETMINHFFATSGEEIIHLTCHTGAQTSGKTSKLSQGKDSSTLEARRA